MISHWILTVQINLQLPLFPRLSVSKIYDSGKSVLLKYNMNLIEYNHVQIAKVCDAIINVIRGENWLLLQMQSEMFVSLHFPQ